jgi:hypothetical protein
MSSKKTTNTNEVSDELRQIIREEVRIAMRQSLADPDLGKVVKESFLKDVKEASDSDRSNDVSLAEVKEKLGGE